jgi:predicted ATPase
MTNQTIITQLNVKNYRCIQDIEFKLTPLHAVIGPNDSGKSSILRALRTGMQLFAGKFSKNDVQEILPFDPGINDNTIIELRFNETAHHAAFDYRVTSINGQITEEIPQMPDKYFRSIFDVTMVKITPKDVTFGEMIKQLPRMVRLDPDSLRLPGSMIPSSQPIDFKENGIGLAGVLDALMKRNVDGYISIREQVRKLFPTVESIGLENISENEMALEFKLKNGIRVPSAFMSEGMLYYLAFAALQHLEPASVLFIEEPENGLHPSRIHNVMDIIRDISKTTQVLIATHSPLVINEMGPNEVTVVWREDDKGTQTMQLNATEEFEHRSKVYALGELWLSYADGKNEEMLRTGKE